jgi:hypothetical protein
VHDQFAAGKIVKLNLDVIAAGQKYAQELRQEVPVPRAAPQPAAGKMLIGGNTATAIAP